MTFNTYEDLMQAVEDRRDSVLTLEVDMGTEFSQEHEDAKLELKRAEAAGMIVGGQGFLADNIDKLRARVEETRPESQSIWVRFRRLSLADWSLMLKQATLSPIDQYEKVLPTTFIGVWGVDPDLNEGQGGEEQGGDVQPLSTDAELLSSRSPRGILPGGILQQVVGAFMAWQNSAGEVSIRPTRSGRV